MEDVEEGDVDMTLADAGNDEDAEGEEDIEDTQDQQPDTPKQMPPPPIRRRRPDQGPGTPPKTPPQINGTHDPRDPRSNPRTPEQYSTDPYSPAPFRPAVRPEALSAKVYDIAPTIAAPHSTSINAVTATPDMRWVFSGGSDGWVRKFNWIDTANAKTLLTVAQRHPFVDSVTKAGVLMSYWENEDTLDKSDNNEFALSPVYSLAVQHQALWLLSGTESGGINLQTVRHQEGKRITSLYGHTSAVSVMQLSNDETSLLSGSWDKTVHEWDLNTGQVKGTYTGSSGQISAIEIRPAGGVPVPRQQIVEVAKEPTLTNGTFGSNNAAPPSNIGTGGQAGSITLGRRESKVSSNANGVGSPSDSLFGGGVGDNDSLFGDNDGAGGGTDDLFGGGVDQEDDDFAKASINGMQNHSQGDNDLDLSLFPTTSAAPPPSEPGDHVPQIPPTSSAPATNGLPEPEPFPPPTITTTTTLPTSHDIITSPFTTDDPTFSPTAYSSTTFLDASIDGTLRIWDRRRPTPIAHIPLPRNVPVWCMAATWSPSGNHIYVGRRNNTVDEYSLHGNLNTPSRTLRFPGGSGAVSAVRVMPNGRHLLCASHDILRLYDLEDGGGGGEGLVGGKSGGGGGSSGGVPFLIVPGHRTGVVSQLYLDPKCEFLISTGGNRGWEGASTEVLLGYEIACL